MNEVLKRFEKSQKETTKESPQSESKQLVKIRIIRFFMKRSTL